MALYPAMPATTILPSGWTARARAKSRSEVFSAVFVVSYAALGLPSLAAGLAAPSWGLETTSYLYIALVGALSLTATLFAGRHLASRLPNRRGHTTYGRPARQQTAATSTLCRSAVRTPLSVRQTA